MRLRFSLLCGLALAAMLPAPARPQQAVTPAAQAPAMLAQPALMTLDDVGTGRLLLRSDEPGRYVSAPLVSTDISVSVTGPILRATVTQRFLNPTDQWVEGVYAFPLPEDSAVDALRMRIGERFIEGEIKERQEAREIYEEAKAEGKKAALVEQERPNLFTNSVANIGPGEAIVAQIEFQQALAPRDGRWELRMPLVVAPRYSPDPVVQVVDFLRNGWGVKDPVPDRDRITPPVADPRHETPGSLRNPVEIAVDLAPGFEIAGLESPFHEIAVAEDAPGRARVSLTGAVPADRDFVLRWTAGGSEPQAALFRERRDGAEHLLLMLTPPDLGPADAVAPREVILVQDISGSMSGTSIAQAREGLEMALRRLRPEDSFNLIAFNDRFAVFAEAPVPATEGNVERAIRAVRGLQADGGTEMLPALEYALQAPADPGRLRQVIFLTDGAVGNEAQMLAAIERDLGRSRLFTVGIGSAPNSFFMSAAAERGRGAHVYIGDLAEVAARMGELFARIETPAITDLALTLPEGMAAEVLPSPLPDLYAGDPVTVAIRAPRAEGMAVLSGRRGAQEWQVRLPLDGAAERPGVARLFARKRIAGLEALRLSSTIPAEALPRIDAELLQTALGYGLVSRLTSLVAVDVTPSRPQGAELASTQVPLNLPAGWDPKAFLFEDYGAPAPAPLLDRAALRRIAPQAQATQAALAEPEAAPVPAGALNWFQSLVLGLLMMLTGALVLLVLRAGRAPRGHR